MGTIKSGILGGFSGKVGGVIGTSWKGIAVMKAMPQSVANPRTNAQVAQRNSMSAIVTVAGLLLANYIKPLWDRFAQEMSGYNAFVQANISLFPEGVFHDYDMLTLSKGKMAATQPVVSAVADGDLYVDVTFSTAIVDAYQQATDLMYCLIYDTITGTFNLMSGTVARSSGTIRINLSQPAIEGSTLWVYLAARRADGTVVSDTGVSSTVVVA